MSDDSQAKAPSIAQSKISQVKVINPSKIRVHINGDKKATSTVTTVHSDKDEQPRVVGLTSTDSPNIDYPKPLPVDSFPDKGEGGSVPATITNLKHLLNYYGIQVKYNAIKKKVKIIIPDLSGSPDNADNTARSYIISLAILNKMPTGQIANFIDAIADKNQYNPVVDWILSRPWDRKDRLQALFDTLHECDDFPRELKETLMYRWLLGAVAAVFLPIGFRARGVLTLQGPQSIGKTAWVNALINNPILKHDVIKLDHHMDPTGKDSKIESITNWIIEIGELDGSFKKDIARLKGFITSDKDKLRLPYARTASEFQRRTVFCATVNSETFLVDDTGNTRWWTIPVTVVDYKHDIDMQQVFAQLKTDFDKGVQWWLTTAEEICLEQHNKRFRSVSAIQEQLLNAIDIERSHDNPNFKAMSATEILRAIGIKYPTNAQCKECHSFMREHLGAPKKIQGVYKWRVAFLDNSNFISYGQEITPKCYGDGQD